MKMSSALAKALNDQIAMEANAVNAYLAAGSWCEITGYDGSAVFFYAHAEEEHLHMLKFINFLNGERLFNIFNIVKAFFNMSNIPNTFFNILNMFNAFLNMFNILNVFSIF